jgi:hypothetical protein
MTKRMRWIIVAAAAGVAADVQLDDEGSGDDGGDG